MRGKKSTDKTKKQIRPAVGGGIPAGGHTMRVITGKDIYVSIYIDSRQSGDSSGDRRMLSGCRVTERASGWGRGGGEAQGGQDNVERGGSGGVERGVFGRSENLEAVKKRGKRSMWKAVKEEDYGNVQREGVERKRVGGDG